MNTTNHKIALKSCFRSITINTRFYANVAWVATESEQVCYEERLAGAASTKERNEVFPKQL